MGLLLFHRCGALRQQFSKTNDVRVTDNRERVMKDWTEGEIRWIALDTIGECYRRYRLPDAAAEVAMGRDARTVAELADDLLTEIDLP